MDILTRVLIERDKWLRDFTVPPNALYLGHDEYDQLRLENSNYTRYDSTFDSVAALRIFRVNVPSHFSIGVVK